MEQAGLEPLPGEGQAGCFMEAARRPGPEAQGGQMEGPWQTPLSVPDPSFWNIHLQDRHTAGLPHYLYPSP